MKKMYSEIKCGFCGQKFESDIGYKQGNYIASDLFADGVISSYGSIFDGMIFIFEETKERNDLFSGKRVQICDHCISKLIESGLLHYVDDYIDPFHIERERLEGSGWLQQYIKEALHEQEKEEKEETSKARS